MPVGIWSLETPTPTKMHSPAFQAKLEKMAISLAPLVQVTTGRICDEYPKTILNFWLLTSEQLDELARFYHQRRQSCWSSCYPMPIQWCDSLSIEEKRRRFGQFIGLRGCENPFPVLSDEALLERVRNARLTWESTWDQERKKS